MKSFKKQSLQSEVSCKIYWFLLFLCYLEIVLWTSCLLGSTLAGAAGDSQGYLIRETDNLKLARLQQHRLNSLPEAAPRVHLKAEQDGLAQSQERGDNPVLLQPGLFSLRLTQGSDSSTGLPAPYTGIKSLI